jgi:hypothetical protein
MSFAKVVLLAAQDRLRLGSRMGDDDNGDLAPANSVHLAEATGA